MGKYISPIKLGRPRNEVEFTANIDELSSFAQTVAAKERIIRTASGEGFRRVFRRQTAAFRIRPSFPSSDTLKNELESLMLISDEPLSFVFANDFPVFSEKFLVTDPNGIGGGLGDTILLRSSPYTLLGAAYKAAGGGDGDIITINRVSLLYDPKGAQADLDLFSSYDAAKRIITISPSQFIDTTVYVNWSYKGALVFLKPFRPSNKGGHVSGSSPLWSISMTLDGV